MPKDKKLKIVFDPVFFEKFDGSQEELDAMMEEIMGMFEGKSADEIKAMSSPVDWDSLDEDERQHLEAALHRAHNDVKPTLQ
jgi:hypothetical protein